MNPPTRAALRWWTIGFALIGVSLVASLYLLERSFAARVPGAHAANDLCSALFLGSCDQALSGPHSWFLGIPLAGWGLVYFSALAGLLVLARFMEGTFEANALLAASVLAVFGVAVGVALIGTALLAREPVCPICLSIHIIDVAILLTLQRLVRRPFRDQGRAVRDAAVHVVRGAHASESVRWQLVGFAAVVLVAAVTYQWVYVETALSRASSASDPAQEVAAYRASPEQALPVSADDPHLGPLDAPVQLVVFESFRCAHCRRFAPTLSRLRRTFGDRLLVTFKHYPLSTRCNERLTRDLQPGSCELAWAAEAANAQARFWPFHDVLLAAEAELSATDLSRMARRFGLDPARFEADRRSDAVRRRVAEDIELGNRLQLPGTPATFLDGRLVRSPSPERLEILIRDALQRKATESTPAAPAARTWERPQRSASGG